MERLVGQSTGISKVTDAISYETLIVFFFFRSLSLFFILFCFFCFFFSDPGSRPSSPNAVENPLDAAIKARRKDQDEKETGGKSAKLELRL